MTAASPWAGLLHCDTTPDGLQTITEVLVALADGVPVPQRSAEHLAQALRPCLTGDNGIAGRLGLRAPRRGGAHEAPATLAKKLRRDALVSKVIDGMGAPTKTAAMALGVLWCFYRAEPQNPADRAAGGRSKNFPALCELADYPPLSYRQILRIVSGEPAYAKR